VLRQREQQLDPLVEPGRCALAEIRAGERHLFFTGIGLMAANRILDDLARHLA
jgi:hypothetical protein